MTFDLEYALSILPALLQASQVTFVATVGGFILALVGGMVVAVAGLSRSGTVRTVARTFTDVVRCTPLLIQLFYLFFVLPYYGIRFDPLQTGIAALGLHYSAFTAEVYRAGILAVPRGQWEAAAALHLGPRPTWFRIVLPQALVPIVPVLGNYLISMFKTSALLATITVPELLGKALTEASRSFRYVEPITIVGAIFITFSLIGVYVVRFVSKRLARMTGSTA